MTFCIILWLYSDVFVVLPVVLSQCQVGVGRASSL